MNRIAAVIFCYVLYTLFADTTLASTCDHLRDDPNQYFICRFERDYHVPSNDSRTLYAVLANTFTSEVCGFNLTQEFKNVVSMYKRKYSKAFNDGYYLMRRFPDTFIPQDIDRFCRLNTNSLRSDGIIY